MVVLSEIGLNGVLAVLSAIELNGKHFRPLSACSLSLSPHSVVMQSKFYELIIMAQIAIYCSNLLNINNSGFSQIQPVRCLVDTPVIYERSELRFSLSMLKHPMCLSGRQPQVMG